MRLPARMQRLLGPVLTLATLVVIVASSPARAQVSIPSFVTSLNQNFNTLASSGTSTALPVGWHLLESGSGADATYTASDGSASTGDTYSFGSTASTDRAFGGLRFVSLPTVFDATIGAEFVNNTGGTIGSVSINYTGEQWRLGAVGRTDQLVFQYSTDATTLDTGTWIRVDALVFTAPTTSGTVGALNGNASANRTLLAGTICGLNITNGAKFWIRWTDFAASGMDDGLGVDDFSLNARGIRSIAIGNVPSFAEGNSGTTAFQFPLTLSSSTACDVSVHFATADGTAKVADGDYLAASGTATIPAGSTSGTITVQVIGDVKRESNETFTVNLSAPVGVTIIDALGVGTIANDDPVPTLSIGGVTAAEGGSGTTPFTFELSLSNPSDADVTVHFATADGSATLANNDYVAASGMATVVAGATSGSIPVLVNGDGTPEADEDFSVTLSSPVNATLGTATGTGVITDDDAVIPVITASAGPNGTISPSGSVSVALGANKSFVLLGGPCYAPADVVVDGVSAGAVSSYTFVDVQTSHTISATFARVTTCVADNFDNGGALGGQDYATAADVHDSGSPVAVRSAAQFQVPLGSDYRLDSITLPIAVLQNTPGNVLRVRLTTNSASAPGTTLETLSENQGIWPELAGPLATTTTLSSVIHPRLTSGAQYWIVTEPTAIPSGSDAFGYYWFLNSSGTSAPWSQQQQLDGSLPSDPWPGGASAEHVAFRVDGTPASDVAVDQPAMNGRAFELGAPHPNPARGAMNVEFRLGVAAMVRSEVFDAMGQRVRLLEHRELPAGAHWLEWDGRDGSGRRAAPGVYLVRVSTGTATSVRRFVLVH